MIFTLMTTTMTLKGEARTCPDRAGEAATAIDVIFHPSIVLRAMEDKGGPTIMGQPRHTYYQCQLGSLALKNAEGELGTPLDTSACKLLKTGYKGGSAPAMFPWVDGMWSPEHSDDPRKKTKKYAGAREGLSGALAAGGGGVLVTEKLDAAEMITVATSRLGGKGQTAVKKGFLSGGLWAVGCGLWVVGLGLRF
jgi:hypothetical protein